MGMHLLCPGWKRWVLGTGMDGWMDGHNDFLSRLPCNSATTLMIPSKIIIGIQSGYEHASSMYRMQKIGHRDTDGQNDFPSHLPRNSRTTSIQRFCLKLLLALQVDMSMHLPSPGYKKLLIGTWMDGWTEQFPQSLAMQ